MSTIAAPHQLREMIKEELADLISIRRDLHAHPELGYNEHRTSGVVQRELEAAGIDFARNLAGGTGVLGHLPGEAARAIALRADMDALPITEQTGAPYASTSPGVMHACGHDGHTTMLIGAARVLARLAEESPLPRPVTFVFQPAEEGGAGGQKMVQDGCLDGSVIGPPVEMIFGLHGWTHLPLGVVSTRVGPMLAASDRFEIVVRGTGSHAAYPQISRDPIVAGAAIVQALQQIASRNVGPLDSVVVSVTQFHAGTTHNIIPAQASISGTLRTLLPETRSLASKRLIEIAQHIARAHGCEADATYIEGYPVTRNDAQAVAIFNTVAREMLGEANVPPLENPVMGGEDFSYYGEVVPACFFALGLIPKGKTVMPDLHQSNFDFNDDAIAIGVELFCRLALRA
ncbi:MAG TPA: amidohydrolase [Phycisphaerales bacterium]|nr:amidohydrolase [Phycisphaerales bacterium]HRQ74989.1 amidohydrolase [Phycisphaerales bacterium]